jgi:putative protease
MPAHLTVRTDNLNLFAKLNSHVATDLPFSLIFVLTKAQLLQLQDQAALDKFVTNFSPNHRIALPLILRDNEPTIAANVVDSLVKHGIAKFEIGNLGALHIVQQVAKQHEISADITADHTLYTRNSEAARFLLECGINSYCLSPEDSFENINSKFFNAHVVPTALVFANVALMHSESCVLTNSGAPCKHGLCSLNGRQFKDERGRCFVIFSDACRMIITAEKSWSQISSIDSLWQLGIRNFRIDFVWKEYSLTAATEVIHEISTKLRSLG